MFIMRQRSIPIELLKSHGSSITSPSESLSKSCEFGWSVIWLAIFHTSSLNDLLNEARLRQSDGTGCCVGDKLESKVQSEAAFAFQSEAMPTKLLNQNVNIHIIFSSNADIINADNKNDTAFAKWAQILWALVEVFSQKSSAKLGAKCSWSTGNAALGVF